MEKRADRCLSGVDHFGVGLSICGRASEKEGCLLAGAPILPLASTPGMYGEKHCVPFGGVGH